MTVSGLIFMTNGQYEQAVKTMSMLPWAALWSKRARMLRQTTARLLAGAITNQESLQRVKETHRKYCFKQYVAKFQLAILAIISALVTEHAWLSQPFRQAFAERFFGTGC